MSELRRASALASEVLSALFDARDAAAQWRRTNDEADAKRFIAALYEAEDRGAELETMLRDGGLSAAFAGPHLQPVTVVTPPASSAHEALMNLGAETGHVAFALMRTAVPGYYQPGVEYQVPPLPAEPDMLAHVGVAVGAFLAAFPDEAALNALSAMLTQELARAKTDTKTDTPKKISTRKPRPLNATAAACALQYRKAKKADISLRLRPFVEEWAEANGKSAASIYRALLDNPNATKV